MPMNTESTVDDCPIIMEEEVFPGIPNPDSGSRDCPKNEKVSNSPKKANFSKSTKPSADMMKKMVASKTVETMKEIDLINFINSIGGSIINTKKFKKDELVSEIYAHFENIEKENFENSIKTAGSSSEKPPQKKFKFAPIGE